MGRIISLTQRREDARVEQLAFVDMVAERMTQAARMYGEDLSRGIPRLATVALLKDTREQALRTRSELAGLGGDVA